MFLSRKLQQFLLDLILSLSKAPLTKLIFFQLRQSCILTQNVFKKFFSAIFFLNLGFLFHKKHQPWLNQNFYLFYIFFANHWFVKFYFIFFLTAQNIGIKLKIHNIMYSNCSFLNCLKRKNLYWKHEFPLVSLIQSSTMVYKDSHSIYFRLWSFLIASNTLHLILFIWHLLSLANAGTRSILLSV